MNYIIRPATKEDIRDVTKLVAITWNETYKGLVSDEYLKSLYNNEEERYQRHLKKFINNEYQELVLEIDGSIVGFLRYAKSNDTMYDNLGEIYAFYIINKYHGLGLGRKLFEEGVAKLKEMGYDKMIIACLKDNPTNEFYKHMGGTYLKEGIFTKLNLKENIYYFDI